MGPMTTWLTFVRIPDLTGTLEAAPPAPNPSTVVPRGPGRWQWDDPVRAGAWMARLTYRGGEGVQNLL